MGTQEYAFGEQAAVRYQRTWRGFEAIFRRGGYATLSAYCKSVHVNYEGMKKWVSASGLSVRRLKHESRRSAGIHKGEATQGATDMFVHASGNVLS